MEVSDADREAASEYVRRPVGFLDKEYPAQRLFTHDELSFAFAKVRHQTLSTQSAELDALRGDTFMTERNEILRSENRRLAVTIAQLRDRVAGLEELLRDAGTTSVRLEYSAGWHARRRALLTQNEVG